jgi:hypothetical protein
MVYSSMVTARPRIVTPASKFYLASFPRLGAPPSRSCWNPRAQTRWRLWATGAPFAARDMLKKRDYRWSAGDDGRPRAWNIEVSEDQRPLELQFLRSEVFRSEVIEVPANPVTAFDRYSTRD